MKKPIAIAFALTLMLGTVYADGPGNPRPGANPTAPQPNATPAPRPGADSAPDGPVTLPAPVGVKHPKNNHVSNGAAHGQKKGWSKNPHNPHNAKCDNPGHASK